VAGLAVGCGGCGDRGGHRIADRFALISYLRNALWVIFTITVSFWIGVLWVNIFPGLHTEPLKMLIDTAVAVGTIGAVVVALWQLNSQRIENQSRTNLTEAKRALDQAVNDFLARQDSDGRPLNRRRHWLTFARGILIAQSFGERIKDYDLRKTWAETEHYWRDRTYDALYPNESIPPDSFPSEYYGYMDDKEFIKNFAQSPGDRVPISEASLTFIYRWAKWPEGRADPLDRHTKFTDDELESMEMFGPRGLGRYIKKCRDYFKSQK
jgi:hypothetical protein